MTLSFVASSTVAQTSSGTTVTPAEPAGSANLDLIIACIVWFGPGTLTLPGGWTSIYSISTGAVDNIANHALAYFPRKSVALTAGERTFTISVGNDFGVSLAGLRSSRGVPVYERQSSATLGANGTTPTTAGFTTSFANELLLMLAAGGGSQNASTYQAATDPVAANWTERRDTGSVGGNASLAIATAIKTTAGATGTFSYIHGTSSRHGIGVAAFTEAYALAGNNGSYVTTGQASLGKKSVTVVASNGSYAYNGQAANFKYNRVLALGQGSYVTTGQASFGFKGLKVAVEPGIYAYNGQDISFLKGTSLISGFGLYSYSGFDATLTFHPNWVWNEDVPTSNTWQEAAAVGSSWVEESLAASLWAEPPPISSSWSEESPLISTWIEET